MKMVHIGFALSALATLIGMIWLAAKMVHDDRRNFSYPMGMLIYGAIAFSIFFLAGTQKDVVARAEYGVRNILIPCFVFAGTFVASIPMLICLQEHGLTARLVTRFFVVACIASVLMASISYAVMR